MAGMLPASVYGLQVPAGGIPVPGAHRFPATFRVTMAAIDPTAVPQIDEENKFARATLKIIRLPMGDEDEDDEDDEDYDEDDIEAIKARLKGIISDEEDMSDSEDEAANGGPSDPAKAKQAKKAALTKKMQEELEAEEMELDSSFTNGKGKGKACDDSDCDSEIDDDEPEEFVLCTLDPEKNCQQTLDITVGEHEQVYFQSVGAYDIYLTGNYVFPPDMDEDEDEDDEEDMDYDLSPDEDELDEDISESEEDELDGMENPRVTEVESEEEAPKLVEKSNKGKKRGAETLDSMIEAAANGAEKASKKDAKKLKKNDGQAVAAAQESAKKEPSSDKKKVQFSKNLEMGPTGSPKVEEKKAEPKKEAAKPAGPRVVQGVTIDDKKAGKGAAAKKGSRVEMRYIGKLKNGKQFDANKKGKPFSFKLGVGEVIKGWDIGVMGMCPGGERRLTIPAKLAYGNRALPDIPANSDLIFDIKCISVS